MSIIVIVTVAYDTYSCKTSKHISKKEKGKREKRENIEHNKVSSLRNNHRRMRLQKSSKGVFDLAVGFTGSSDRSTQARRWPSGEETE